MAKDDKPPVTEDALRRSEERFRKIFEHSNDAIFVIDPEDGEILEVNQVAAYFAYANRTVTGLGVSTEGEKLGLSPDDGDGWEHL